MSEDNVITLPGGQVPEVHKIDPAAQLCGNCAFALFPEGSQIGECRERPPVAIIVPEPQRDLRTGQTVMGASLKSFFPPVSLDTFCHMFEHVGEDEPAEDTKH
jgi:hypothetical protein